MDWQSSTFRPDDTAPEQDDICLHCKCPKNFRNLSGDCDHLYWPENLTDEAKRANGLTK